ncbi:MAG: tRNA uridine-5-carboxymethylaminomethyl(34) synthesis GTPase MnmE [Magnetospirillum sp.]|nr:tRNA uridine-5-carboxymethylaminomethyl(34) synthesis GTPase MnmE [Magnetospirillum sp.]
MVSSVSRPTIYAPATAAGRAGVAVLRVSGPEAGMALRALARRAPPPRVATRARLVDPADGAPLDDALVLWFPGPASFTGEDVAEFHLHGSRAAIDGVLAALAALPGLRLARPGEFARRAFDAGKLDLAEVEALADLIAAETRAQARQALAQLGGALGARIEGLRDRTMRLLAQAEAEIDFPDEGDAPQGAIGAMRPGVDALAADIAALLDDGRRGEILREGFSVAILGPPNAGKSSLLNRLAGRDAAIVSEIAGTTRDTIEVRLDLGGWPVVLWDTAGLRALDAADPQAVLEREGMRRTRARADAADLKLIVLDARDPVPSGELAELARDGLVVLNKADLAPGAAGLAVSALTGSGIEALEARLSDIVAARLRGDASDAPILTRARHREALAEALAALARARALDVAELVGEELRACARALGRIVGRTGVEDVLDVLFGEFCIGK